MGAKTRALLDYQEIELQIVDIRRQLDRRQRQIDLQTKKVEASRSSLAGETGELRRAQMQIDELDVELKARNAHLTKLREQLNSVRTNKEYAAILSQLNNDKADFAKVEARALEMMAALELRKQGMSGQQSAEKTDLDRLAQLQGEFEQTRQLYADRLGELEQQKAAAAAHLDKAVIDMFHRLAERWEGEAMAECLRVSPRRDDYSCGGCNMSLTSDMANALRVKDDLFTCKNCGRVLYFKE